MSAGLRAGYKQTEVGVIPEDWGVACVGDAFEVCNNLRLPISSAVREQMLGDFPYYGPTSIQGWINEFRVEGEYALIGEDGDHFLKWRTQPMTLLVRGRFNVNNHAHLVRGCSNVTAWFYWYFVNRDITASLTRQGASRYKLNKATLLQLPCVLPTLPEQRAIAAALSDVDALLGGLDRLIAKKRDLKQAAMQQLLTGQTRLPGFSGEWVVKRLGDLGSIYGGLTGKTKTDFGEGAARYITFMNVMSNVVIDCEIFDRVNVSPAETQNRAKKGDLFFNGSSETPEEVAMCAVLLDDVQDVYLNSFCFGFRFREDVAADGVFFAYYLRSKEGRELMKSLAQGSTRYNLSKVALLNSSIRLPAPPEQTAIAAILSDMDTELAALQARRSKTQALKQAMMQELLTGRIRLI